MNGDLVPAVVAASGGSAMIAGIHLWERKQLAAMRASMVPLGLRFPSGLEPSQALASLDGLAGLPHTTELIAEITAKEGLVTHALWVPAVDRASVQSTMTGVIPSLRITEPESSPEDAAMFSLRLFIPTPSVLSGDNPISASRSLLTNLAGLRSGERVVIRFALRPAGARPRQGVENPSQRQRDIDRAWQRKAALPGFNVSGLVLIRASKARARELASHIENVLRGRKGLTAGIRVTSVRGDRRLSAMPHTTRPSGWLSTAEIVPLLAWPLGADVTPGVELGGRELRASAHLPKAGRRLFLSRSASGEERPVALDATAARHHMAVIGPSGVGKSVLLARAVLSDISAGFGGAVIDPKADLIDTILDRVPAEHAHRIVVLDAGDSSRPTPGVAVLSGGDPDSRADVLTGTLKAIFGSAVWGVRSEFYGRLAIRTLGEIPGATLADMGRLFYEEPYRRAAIARLRDPFLISSWQAYENLSGAARAEHVQAPMARVMTLLSRPKVRAVLASPEPKLDLAQLFRERKWLLVSLAPGVLSEAGATLVGAAVMYAIWSAIETRVALPPEKRSPIFLYVDELTTLTNGLPFGFELLAERARGLGAGLAVALQTLGRIGEPTKSALAGNLATWIVFRAGATEAPRLALELPGLSAADLQALGRFEVAARVASGSGSAVSVVTGRTEPLPPMTGQAETIRDASARAYGSAPAEPEPSIPPSPTTTEAQNVRTPGRTGRQA